MLLRFLVLLLAALPCGLIAAEEASPVASEKTDAADDAVDGELLEGSWKLVRAEQGGQATSSEALSEAQIVIALADGAYTIDGPVKDHGLYVCDDTPDPKTIDLIAAEGENKDKPIHAIYKVDGNELTICYDFDDQRPTEFSTKARETLFMAVYKRQ
jgi:uncharacterized protein (TIGR03067 family)